MSCGAGNEPRRQLRDAVRHAVRCPTVRWVKATPRCLATSSCRADHVGFVDNDEVRTGAFTRTSLAQIVSGSQAVVEVLQCRPTAQHVSSSKRRRCEPTSSAFDIVHQIYMVCGKTKCPGSKDRAKCPTISAEFVSRASLRKRKDPK